MLLQTNSYIVPKDKRAAHNHLMQRFRQALQKIGCDHFEVYEQVGANWNGIDAGGRFVQLMKFRDRKHCAAVQLAERQDPAAQALVKEFCDLINFPYQEQQGLFAHGYYQAVIEPIRTKPGELAFHHFEGEDVRADTARRIAAGLPDTPHSIDDAPGSDATEIDPLGEMADVESHNESHGELHGSAESTESEAGEPGDEIDNRFLEPPELEGDALEPDGEQDPDHPHKSEA